VLLALSPHLTDEGKLDRMVPYIVDLLHDDAAIVRAAGLRTLMQVVSCTYDVRLSGNPFLKIASRLVNAGYCHHTVKCHYIP
jgi:hypothetical protein